MDLINVTQETLDEIKNLNSIGVKVEIDFTNTSTYVEIPSETILEVSINDKLESAVGGSIANTASISLDNTKHYYSPNLFQDTYDPLLNAFNGTQKPDGYGNLRPWRKIKISLKVGTSTEWVERFVGYIDGKGFQESIGKGTNNKVTLKLIDKSKLLIDTEYKIGGTPKVLTNFKVCDPNDMDNSLVHFITRGAGIPDTDVVAATISNVVSYCVLDGNGWEILSSVAEEYLGIVTFKPDGKLFFGDSRLETAYWENITPAFTIGNDTLRSIKRVNGWDDIKNDVIVKWDRYDKLDKQRLWHFDQNYNNETELCEYVIPSGNTELDITNPNVEYSPEYVTDDGYEVIYADDLDTLTNFNNRFQSTGSLNIDVYDTTTYQNKAVIRLSNSTGLDVTLQKAEIHGSPLVKLETVTENQQSADSIYLYGRRKIDKTAKYLSNLSDLQNYTAWLKDFYSEPHQTFNITIEKPYVNLTLGSFISLEENLQGSGISGITCVVKDIKYNIKTGGRSTVTLTLQQWLVDWTPTIITVPTITPTEESQGSTLPVLEDDYIEEQHISNGAVTTPTIAESAITTDKLSAGSVTTDKLSASSVQANNIGANVITSNHIASDTIKAENIEAGTITGTEISANAITGTHIDSNTITSDNIVSGTITTNEISSGTITGTNIDSETITSSNILSGTIQSSDIATNTIVAGNIASETITGNEIAGSTITGNHIDSNTITANNIVIGTITSNEIATGTINASNIDSVSINTSLITSDNAVIDDIIAGQIDATTITVGLINGNQIGANTITASNIQGSTITGTEINAETITGNHLVSATITSSQIASNTITANNIASNTITSNEIKASSIVGGDIASNTITATNIASNTITANEIVSQSITSSEIASNTITGATIVGETVTAGNIKTGSITTADIATGTIKADNIQANSITSNEIASGTIVAGNIDSNSINTSLITSTNAVVQDIISGHIDASTITVGSINATQIDLTNLFAQTITVNGAGSITVGDTLMSADGISGSGFNLTTTDKSIGGWLFNNGSLQSGVDSVARIDLNPVDNRIEVWGDGGTEPRTAMGYLKGLSDPTNRENTITDGSVFGFWTGEGDSLKVNGEMELANGQFVLKDSSSLDIKDSVTGYKKLRFGDDSGSMGVHTYRPDTDVWTGSLSTPSFASDGTYGSFLKVSNPFGYVDIGSKNTGWCHFYSDRNFWFNKSITIDTGILSSYNEDLYLARAGTTKIQVSSDTVDIKNALKVGSGISNGTTGDLGAEVVRIGDTSAYMYLDGTGSISLNGTSAGTSFDFNKSIETTGNLLLKGSTTETKSIEIGTGRTGNGYAYIDLVGDATYTDYGFRIIRGNGGANTTSTLDHKGTGDFIINAGNGGDIRVQTAGDIVLGSAGTVDVTGTLSTKNINTIGNITITKDNAWLTLDSPSTGGSGVEQGAGISIGESGFKGSAALHLTYTGDGYGHIGMGVVSTTTGLPTYEAMKLYYTNNNVSFLGDITVSGVLNASSDATFGNDIDVSQRVNFSGLDGSEHSNKGVTYTPYTYDDVNEIWVADDTRYGLLFNGDLVQLCNRATNGIVRISANGGGVGVDNEVAVVDFHDTHSYFYRKLQTSNQGEFANITDLTVAPYEVTGRWLDNPTEGRQPSYFPLLSGSNVYTNYGYRKHVNIGIYRTGNGFDGAVYLAQGGNDNYPTEAHYLEYGGNISHSSGTTSIEDVAHFASNSITMDITADAPGWRVKNPNNTGASVTLNWLNDIARLRVGGTGDGAGNGFEIQGPSDVQLLRVTNTGHLYANYSSFDTTYIGGIKLENSSDRSGLLEINKLGTSAWSGIQVIHSSTAEWSVMGNESNFGLYDDQNSKWLLYYTENGALDLRYDGNVKAQTTSTGFDVTGTVSADVFNLNEGSNKINIDPRWNKDSTGTDNGNLHIWATKADGTTYGQAGIALYNGTDYQYLKTTTGDPWLYHQNKHGYISFGPANTSFAHIYSDISGGFYFNQKITTTGDINAKGTYYYGDDKKVIQFNDSWLRLNPDSGFASGIYCGSGVLRTDGTFQVGASGSSFSVSSTTTTVKNKLAITGSDASSQIYVGNVQDDDGKINISKTGIRFDYSPEGSAAGSNETAGNISASSTAFTIYGQNPMDGTGDKYLSFNSDGTSYLKTKTFTVSGDMTCSGDITDYMKVDDSQTYRGMTGLDNSTTNWVRTTSNGLLPHASGGSSYLGTSSWKFNYIYGVNIYGDKVYGAVGNDYADAIEIDNEVDVEFGYVYIRDEDGKTRKSNRYAEEGVIGITTNTQSFTAHTYDGEKDRLPISVSGFVLAHVDKEYKSGTPLTCTNDGRLTKMRFIDRLLKPHLLLATYYKNMKDKSRWNDVGVDGRHLVKVR